MTTITVNGEATQLSAQTRTVAQLLHSLGLGETLVAVERNRAVVPRARYAQEDLCEGDEIEIVHFVGGG